jgi:hypothetical protein
LISPIRLYSWSPKILQSKIQSGGTSSPAPASKFDSLGFCCIIPPRRKLTALVFRHRNLPGLAWGIVMSQDSLGLFLV